MTTLKSGNEPQNCKMASLTDLTPRELEILQLVLKEKRTKKLRGESISAQKRLRST